MSETAVFVIIGGLIGGLNMLILYILGQHTKKLDTVCRDNKKEHDELYAGRNEHEKRITKLETIQECEG